jgi:hypothetical protein
MMWGNRHGVGAETNTMKVNFSLFAIAMLMVVQKLK